MSKFIKFGNTYINKNSIISINLEKNTSKNNIKITTNEQFGNFLWGTGQIEHVVHTLKFAEKTLDAEKYFDDLVKELDD